uniref:MHC class II beta chain N-terminal domain-containing protein n=1 Tax=Terrapene triunguis TaxID=2587831 RepID=A0A674IUG1_9SAUR
SPWSQTPGLYESQPVSPPPEHFLIQYKSECYFTNGTERVRFLFRNIWDRQQYLHFDSDVGEFVADTELGRANAEGWNQNKQYLAQERAAADRFCRYNYGVVQTGKMVGRRGERGAGPW